jgi:hypothetical protein
MLRNPGSENWTGTMLHESARSTAQFPGLVGGFPGTGNPSHCPLKKVRAKSFVTRVHWVQI